ncbi:phytoene/squalene synthase family protein [Rothia halotolerans]|uniref:phytoene/squalene synthase family protein n=1 Tax=Rothia halotolerans TaxID=405770 RepID=UPI001EE0285C|nr:squalene/phytoene synthase family protein [Rothia halotolerans]
MSGLGRYQEMSRAAAASVIGCYSTSFGAATRLLARPERERIRDVYAMVRVADEIVDGPAAAAGLDAGEVAERLDRFEREVFEGIGTGFSANPVVQAFARTARECSLDPEHIRAFFRSMRADVETSDYSGERLEEYIYGSAEVVGLMCLDVFLAGPSGPDAAACGRPAPARTAVHRQALGDGARHLGAAFQKINFLRDLAEDREDLGRDYTGVRSEEEKARAVEDIRRDLSIAAHSLPGLPVSPRTGVTAAYLLFSELTDRIAATPAARLSTARVRVPDAVKVRIVASAVLKARRGGPERELLTRHPALAEDAS